MKVAVLGTGVVGRTFVQGLDGKDVDIVMGTRNPEKTRVNNQKDAWGNPSFADWYKEYLHIDLLTFEAAVVESDMIILAVSGAAVLEIIKNIPVSAFKDKLVWDVTNPLDFSKGMPPSLFISNTDSLGEQIQQALPDSQVVKTLNTISAPLMIQPQMLTTEQSLFVAGNNQEAKNRTINSLKSWFGWTDIIDLGDISQSRGTEMFLALWVRTMAALGTPLFGIKILR